MKIGILSGFNSRTAPELIVATARGVEERGFHSIWMPEHVVFFRDYSSRYPYAPDGRLPGQPDGILEPFTALAYLAAHTERLRLGSGICLVPQRNPLYTARQVADVDFLSGGRVDFGVGIGWLKEEFAALGVPWERRAARTREAILLMQNLWRDEVASFEGEFYTVPECLHGPKPVQKPHPPIFFGGESDAALRRVAELGQGWFGFNLAPEQLPERLQRLETLLRERDRSRREVEVFVCPGSHPYEGSWMARYQELGVDQLILPAGATTRDRLERRLDELVKTTLDRVGSAG